VKNADLECTRNKRKEYEMNLNGNGRQNLPDPYMIFPQNVVVTEAANPIL
jgi:hypothetical protein